MREENSTVESGSLPSSFAGGLSLPSSFASDARSDVSSSLGGQGSSRASSRAMVERHHHHQSSQDENDGRMEVYKGRQVAAVAGEGDDTSASTTSDANSEDQLALRISKETKPMMHLLRLLKEMDDVSGGGSQAGDPKSKAVASLIGDFEKEVTLIEHRIKDENLIMNGEQPPLPPNWIALEDPDSGDIYYANEATGERVPLCFLLGNTHEQTHIFLMFRQDTVGASGLGDRIEREVGRHEKWRCR